MERASLVAVFLSLAFSRFVSLKSGEGLRCSGGGGVYITVTHRFRLKTFKMLLLSFLSPEDSVSSRLPLHGSGQKRHEK